MPATISTEVTPANNRERPPPTLWGEPLRSWAILFVGVLAVSAQSWPRVRWARSLGGDSAVLALTAW